MMSEYNVLNNYLLFQELDSDSIGKNYRAGEIDQETKKAVKHNLLTEVYPFLSENPDVWKRVNILMEGIRKSNIPNLYSPENIIKEEDRALLVFPFLKGRTFEKVLEDASKKDLPINFDLTFSIAIAIADLIDIGSSIVVSGAKSFHGFLTPDNIIIDYDGKIMLKNYGIYPYLSKSEDIFSEIVNKYGAWVSPEFLRKEKLVPQSDIYHLGYIIFRVLTGEYFSYSEGEDFEAKFSNLSFNQHIPSSDTEFFTNIISFFKKTLNPNPALRFPNIKAFKDYISHQFHIEELSSVTFNLAYFMNSLYMENMEEENKTFDEEMAYVIPEPEPEPEPVREPVSDSRNDHLAEDILAGLDDQKGSKMKVIIPVAIAFIILIVVGFYYIQHTQEKAALEAQAFQKQLEAKILADQQKQDALEQKIQDLQSQKTEDATEQAKQDEQMKTLLKERDDRKKRMEADKKKAEAARQKKVIDDAETKRLADIEAEKNRQAKKEADDAAEKERLRLLAIEAAKVEAEKVVEGQVVPLTQVNVRPERISGKDPRFPGHLRRKYSGNVISYRVHFQIDENGNVTLVNIIGTPPQDIKTIIIRTVKKWKYKPATKNGVKVKVWLNLPFKTDFT
ncbi:MAG: protein kinase [bacterium]|nr:protein kinase [bacterium]